MYILYAATIHKIKGLRKLIVIQVYILRVTDTNKSFYIRRIGQKNWLEKKKDKNFGSGGIRTHASGETGA